MAGFIDFLGSGLFLAFSAVYFTQIIGLPTTQVGLGLSIAGLAALVAAVPLGAIADRIGVRRALVLLHLARAAGTIGYALVTGWPGFLFAVIVVTVADQSIASLTQAFVAELADGKRRLRILAMYRTAVNLAISIGSPLGGLALGIHSGRAFRAVLLASSAMYLGVAFIIGGIRQERCPTTAPRRAALSMLGDRRLLALVSIDALLQLWLPVLNLGFPLWLAGHTDASDTWIGVLYGINTLLCVTLQVPAARLAATIQSARRCQVVAGALLSLACAGFAATAYATGALTIALFALAIGLLTGAELIAVSAAWTLSYAIAPDERRAEYLSAFGMGRSSARSVLGPILVTGVLTVAGGWAWAALAGIFAGAAALAPIVLRGIRTTQVQQHTPTLTAVA
jgi:MFS family permease